MDDVLDIYERKVDGVMKEEKEFLENAEQRHQREAFLNDRLVYTSEIDKAKSKKQ